MKSKLEAPKAQKGEIKSRDEVFEGASYSLPQWVPFDVTLPFLPLRIRFIFETDIMERIFHVIIRNLRVIMTL